MPAPPFDFAHRPKLVEGQRGDARATSKCLYSGGRPKGRPYDSPTKTRTRFMFRRPLTTQHSRWEVAFVCHHRVIPQVILRRGQVFRIWFLEVELYENAD